MLAGHRPFIYLDDSLAYILMMSQQASYTMENSESHATVIGITARSRQTFAFGSQLASLSFEADREVGSTVIVRRCRKNGQGPTAVSMYSCFLNHQAVTGRFVSKVALVRTENIPISLFPPSGGLLCRSLFLVKGADVGQTVR